MSEDLDELIARAADTRKALHEASDVARAATRARDNAEDRARDAQRELDRAITARIDELDPPRDRI